MVGGLGGGDRVGVAAVVGLDEGGGGGGGGGGGLVLSIA